MLFKFVLAASLSIGWAASASAQDQSQTLKKIKESNRITLGFRETQVPFSYLDENQKPVGYTIDICLAIVEKVKETLNLPKLEVKFNPETPSTRIPLLTNGTIDLECGSATNNLERQKQISFANTSFVTQSRFVSKKSTGYKRIEDLRGKTVVSTSGSSNMKQLVEINNERKLDIKVITAGEHPEAFLMVETGRAAAFVMDDILLSGLIGGSKDPAAYTLSEEGFAPPEAYGIMMRRDDPEFKQLVDKAISELFRSPKGQQVYAKWFMSPIAPRGLNLSVPMSSYLKKAYDKPTDSYDPATY